MEHRQTILVTGGVSGIGLAIVEEVLVHRCTRKVHLPCAIDRCTASELVVRPPQTDESSVCVGPLAEGWRAVVAGLDQRGLDRAREALGQRDDLRFASLNVADEGGVIRTVAARESEFGPITGVTIPPGSAGTCRQRPHGERAGSRHALDR